MVYQMKEGRVKGILEFYAKWDSNSSVEYTEDAFVLRHIKKDTVYICNEDIAMDNIRFMAINEDYNPVWPCIAIIPMVIFDKYFMIVEKPVDQEESSTTR